MGATAQGASTLCWRPWDPLPLSELIFLYTPDDIQVWLSVTLARILLISGCWSSAWIRERAKTKPQRQPQGDIHFSIVRPWICGGSGMTSELGTTTTTTRVSTTAAAAKMKTMSMTVTTTMSRVLPPQVHDSDPNGGDIIHVDEVSCLFFSLNIVSNQISRRTTGRALNRRMGTPQGAIILPYKIHQADVPGIHNTGIETLGHPSRSGLESRGLLLRGIPALQTS